MSESHGPQGLNSIGVPTGRLFLDHKWVDIPNTVVGAGRGCLMNFVPAIINVFAMGGPSMMKAAAEFFRSHSPETKVIAVTVLTHIDDDELSRILGRRRRVKNYVPYLAELALESGCHGVVCSGQEITSMKKRFGKDFLTVVPGIRPDGIDPNDQKRVMTHIEATQRGADYLVIGRPITNAPDPYEAAKNLLADIRKAA